MNRTDLVMLAVVVAAMFSSCNRSNQSTSSDNSIESLSVNGITISYPRAFDRDDLNIKENNIVVDFEAHKLSIVDGVLKFDSDSYGPVQKGDQIVVQSDGGIQVNSITIAPQ